MGGKHGERRVRIGNPEERARDCVHERVGYEGGEHRAGQGDRAEECHKRDLEAQEDARQRIGVDARDDPADRPEEDAKEGAEQDLHHGSVIRENGHKSTEMHTIMVPRILSRGAHR